MLRVLLTYHLTFLLLVTNVGIPVFTHICHSQAKSWSSILIPAKSCCQKIKSDGCTSTCHVTKENLATEIGKLPCCEDQKSFVQLDVTYLQQLPVNSNMGALHTATTGSVCPSLDFFCGTAKIDNKPHGPPVKGSGRQLLLSYGNIRC